MRGLQITLHGGMPPPGILQRALAQVSVEQLSLASLQAEWERAKPVRERRPNDAGEEYRQPGLGCQRRRGEAWNSGHMFWGTRAPQLSAAPWEARTNPETGGGESVQFSP